MVRDFWLSVNQWPFYDPGHFFCNTQSLLDFEISVTFFESFLSTNTLLLPPSSMIVYTFHHDSVCSWQLWFTGSLHTTLSSPSVSSSCLPSTLLLTLVPTLFIVLLSTLRQHLHKLIHSTLSILFFLLSVRYLWKRGHHYRRWKAWWWVW